MFTIFFFYIDEQIPRVESKTLTCYLVAFRFQLLKEVKLNVKTITKINQYHGNMYVIILTSI